jgi:hypothetical protein
MGTLMEIRMGYGPLMEFFYQRILAFISGLKNWSADGLLFMQEISFVEEGSLVCRNKF